MDDQWPSDTDPLVALDRLLHVTDCIAKVEAVEQSLAAKPASSSPAHDAEIRRDWSEIRFCLRVLRDNFARHARGALNIAARMKVEDLLAATTNHGA